MRADESVAVDNTLPSQNIKTQDFVTVTINGQEYQLRRLTPHQLAIRAAWRNSLLFLIGALILALVAYALR